jgi:hypothetical protein
MNDRLKANHRLQPEVEPTLNHDALAGRLMAPLLDAPPLVLFCDELTALGVLRALKGRGRLLFPLNSDASVARYPDRRSLPTHPLGVGYHVQSKRAEDLERIFGLFPLFLESEREMVTALYIEL